MALTPTFVDISHYDTLETDGWGKLERGGYFGVFHKVTQGVGLVDKTYAGRHRDVSHTNLKWGGYHFAEDADPVAQADSFLEAAQLGDDELPALDWERSPHFMTTDEARAWLERVMEKTGRPPKGVWIYGGELLRALITKKADVDFFGQFPLWQSAYGPKAKPMKPWPNGWTAWQFTGDGVGPGPHTAPGIFIPKGIDNNVVRDGFDFDRDWGANKPVVVASAAKPVGIADLVPVSRKAALMSQFKRAWQGLSLASVMSYLGMSQDTYDKVSGVIHDHWLAIVVTVAVLCILIAKAFEGYMVDDVNSGRATPSGSASA